MRFVSAIFLTLWASSSVSQIGVESLVHRGFLLPHHQNMLHLPTRQSNALELRLFKKCSASKEWSALYREPLVGVMVRLIDLTNPDILGYGIGTAAFFSAPVLISKKLTWNLEMASGLGYLTKKFEYKSNYKNIAIGSHLNAFIALGQRIAFQCNDQLYISATASFNHFSNAAFSSPNLGLNYPLIGLGGGWIFHKTDTSQAYSGSFKKIKSNWMVSARFGIKESTKPRDKKCAVWIVTGSRDWGISRKTSLVSGVDLFYNGAIQTTNLALGDSTSVASNIQAGVHGGYQLHIDDFTAMILMGVYLLDNHKRDGALYHRVGMRYFVSKHWGGQLSLKTHFFKADYFELGAICRF